MTVVSALSWLSLALLICGVLYMIRKSGKDAVEKGAAQDALKDINDALRPPSADERERVQREYRRD